MNQQDQIIAEAERRCPVHIYEHKVDVYTGKMIYKDLNQEKRTEFISGATFGLSLNGWVKVTDRLPTKEDWNLSNNVLVIDASENISIDLYDYTEHDWVRRNKVTHWMPLPEKPTI